MRTSQTRRSLFALLAIAAQLSASSLANAKAQPTKKIPAPASAATPVAPAAKTIDQTTESTPDKSDAVAFNAKDVWNVDIFDREDHKVLVIQDRKYNKAGRIEAGLDLGIATSSPYYSNKAFGGHVGYHLTEYLGLEVYAAKFHSKFSPDGTQLNDFFNAYNFPASKEFRRPESFVSVSGMWSPIYGKFAFFRSNIIYFDFYGQAGVSMFKTTGVKNIKQGQSVTDAEKATAQNHLGSLLAVGARAFINETWIWRFDIRNNLHSVSYAATTANGAHTKRLESAFQFTTGVSLLFNVGGF